MELRLGHFVALMAIVVAVQGMYLGYVIGILTALERRFGISSEMSGLLLSLYDIGHTVAILTVGYFGRKRHAPRLTGIGVVLSAVSMFLLALPVAIYGTVDHDQAVLLQHKELYAADFKCDAYRELSSQGEDCKKEHIEHAVAYMVLALGQILAGICAAPFNTIAYVYVDANASDPRKSPFYLGLLTSMYAFAPALGFSLAAGLNRVYTTLGEPPTHVNPRDEHWVGAWWLGFVICGTLYLLTAIPFFFFPKSFKRSGEAAKSLMHQEHQENDEEHTTCAEDLKELPHVVGELLENSVFLSMVAAWVFGSYLIGGYQTYLPKYIETQFGRSASAADVYAGFISIGAIASSTALGGWILARWNVGPRKAILLLAASWALIMCTYLLGMAFGCEQPKVEGLQLEIHSSRWSFYDTYGGNECSSSCECESVFRFEPVNADGINYFSPCHAGCRNYDIAADQWYSCSCVGQATVENGLIHEPCSLLFAYIPVMFIGLFAGNLFFMVTMMIVLRSVYDDQKVMALSLASGATNLFGFIPAPILFGFVVDSACSLWSSRCPHNAGNCVVYDNSQLRFSFHGTNAGIQALAVLCVILCYFFSRKVTLPEEEEHEPFELKELPPTQPARPRVTDF